MKPLASLLLLALTLCSGCSDSSVLTPREFSSQFAETLRKADPTLTVTMAGDTELKATSAAGHETTSYLDNAYGLYKQDPKKKAEVIQQYVTITLKLIHAAKEDVDRTRIVPIIKDTPWLNEIRHLASVTTTNKPFEQVFEDFAPGLVIIYAEDSPDRIRYLTPDDLNAAHVTRSDLRQLACDNLKRLLPKIERRGSNGVYMVTADGNYEASLLLIDSIWSKRAMEVQGDTVVAIPTRDLLLVTGSQNPAGIETLKGLAKLASGESPYRLSPKLFVYRNGKFEEFQ